MNVNLEELEPYIEPVSNDVDPKRTGRRGRWREGGKCGRRLMGWVSECVGE